MQDDPSVWVKYVRSETFTNELIEAIRQGRHAPEAVKDFRNKYRKVDVLLVDDIQFVAGKESTQKEFYNTFVELYQEDKQIVVASDKPLKDILFEDYIKAKFESGISVDLQIPDYEARIEILKEKRDENGYHHISDAIIDYIAANIDSRVTILEGILHKLNALYELNDHTELTLDQAIEIITDEWMV